MNHHIEYALARLSRGCYLEAAVGQVGVRGRGIGLKKQKTLTFRLPPPLLRPLPGFLWETGSRKHQGSHVPRSQSQRCNAVLWLVWAPWHGAQPGAAGVGVFSTQAGMKPAGRTGKVRMTALGGPRGPAKQSCTLSLFYHSSPALQPSPAPLCKLQRQEDKIQL